METQTQDSQPVSGTDYASALKHYRKYSRGRSMRQFCEDEGYDYTKFCRYAREGEKEQAIDREPSTFLEISPESESAGRSCGSVHVKEIRIRFSNGMVLSRRSDDIDGFLSLVRKIVG